MDLQCADFVAIAMAGGLFSFEVKLTLNLKPVITKQPVSVSVTAGAKATFQVTATGASGYQWYYQKPGETVWNMVAVGGTSATYSLTTASRHNRYKYRCTITNSVGSVDSAVVTLTVK